MSLSMPTIVLPRMENRRTVSEPMRPADPVTTITAIKKVPYGLCFVPSIDNENKTWYGNDISFTTDRMTADYSSLDYSGNDYNI